MIVGIDPAMRSLAVVSDTFARKYEILGTARDIEVAYLHEMLTDLLRPSATEPRVFVEAPIQGASRNVQTSVKIAMTVGAVLATGYRTQLVSPSAWKLAVCGKGSLDKAGVSAWLAQNNPAYYSRCDGDQDLIDATCIYLYGRAEMALDRRGVGQRAARGSRRA